MSVLSKALNPEWSVCYNCYEIGHVWTPDCSDAALDIFFAAFTESLKMYTPLYVLSQAFFARKFNAATFMETFKSILRSSCFLSSNALTIIMFFCMTRAMTGRFYYRMHAYIPTFIGSLMAIVIEKPSRRMPLAIYVANIASECLFRLQVEKGNIKAIPRGEVLLFSASMSILLYLIKRQGYGSDPVSMALRVYLGHGEAAKRKSVMPKPIKMADSEECLMLPVADNNANCKAIAQQSTSDGRHASCQHSESCAKYSLTGFALPLAATWAGHVVMSCLKRYRRVYADPSVILDIVQSKSSLKFGLFFGTFSAIYKASSCLLRRYSDGNRDWHGLLGGALAGPSMLIYPNTTITLYLFWKCVETLYWNAINSGHLGYPQLTATIVYALSVSQIAYCVLLAPKHMRPSYMRFIDQITGGRFQLVNRFGLYILAPDAIKGYEDYFPDLDPKLMSNKFMESCFVWLI